MLGAGALLGIALLGGRIAGFGRELLLASTLGVSRQADVAVLLLTLPDLLVNLLLSGGLSVALIPALRAFAPHRAAALFQQASLAVAALFGLLALALVFEPGGWLGALAPGVRFDTESPGFLAAVSLVALAVPLTALSGVSTAYLNARDRFFVAGCGTLLFNACIIAGLMIAPPGADFLKWLGWGIFAGAALRWVSQLAGVPQEGFRFTSGNGVLLDGALFKAFSAAFLSSSLTLLVPVIARALASMLGEGVIATFNYATKLTELPLGILITTLATVAFPRLCGLYAKGRNEDAGLILRSTLQRSATLSAAVVLTGAWFSDAVVSLIFLRGRIDTTAVEQISRLTQVLLLSVPFVGISGLAAAGLNAQGRASKVLRDTFYCLLLLPVLAAPGLWLRSPGVLMGAVVAFQVALAAALMRTAGLPWVGLGGWLDRRMACCLLVMAAVAGACIGVDACLGLRNALWRSVWAAATFAATAWAGARFLSKVLPHPSPPSDEKTD